MKKILITGANSYIGTSFERYLLKYSDEYSIHTVDMTNRLWENSRFSDYDVLFHVAGIAHSDIGKVNEERKKEYYKVNTDLTIEVAKKAKNEGVKQFMFMSSAIVYGDSAPIGVSKIITKNTIPKPSNFYGDTKLKAEKGLMELANDNFKVCILRSPMIYGRGSKGNYYVLAKWAVKLPIFPDIDNSRSMIYIDNLCEFLKLMVDNEEFGIFFPQNNEYVRTSDMVKAITNAHDKHLILTILLNPAIKLLGRHSRVINKVFGNMVYDKKMSEYKQEYALISFNESIRKTEETEAL